MQVLSKSTGGLPELTPNTNLEQETDPPTNNPTNQHAWRMAQCTETNILISNEVQALNAFGCELIRRGDFEKAAAALTDAVSRLAECVSEEHTLAT